MHQRLVLIVLIACLAAPLAAQVPEGWKMRVDRSRSAEDPDDRPDLTFTTMGKGFHVAGGPAGTFWNPKNVATGNYALKATFIPVVSYVGPAAAAVLTGSLVIETIFSLPGMGRYLVQGALNRDYTLVMGMVIVYATLTLLFNLVVDLLYGWLDPRVRRD